MTDETGCSTLVWLYWPVQAELLKLAQLNEKRTLVVSDWAARRLDAGTSEW
jgi:hypothetical protein